MPTRLAKAKQAREPRAAVPGALVPKPKSAPLHSSSRRAGPAAQTNGAKTTQPEMCGAPYVCNTTTKIPTRTHAHQRQVLLLLLWRVLGSGATVAATRPNREGRGNLDAISGYPRIRCLNLSPETSETSRRRCCAEGSAHTLPVHLATQRSSNIALANPSDLRHRVATSASRPTHANHTHRCESDRPQLPIDRDGLHSHYLEFTILGACAPSSSTVSGVDMQCNRSSRALASSRAII